jgi:thymidylate synthase (FAD)
MLRQIEAAGRTCYKSENRVSDGSAVPFVRMLLQRGHESVIEHVSLSVRMVVPRGVSHEIVRHRLASYSQESTRYCNYRGEVEFIRPWHLEDLQSDDYHRWRSHMLACEREYQNAIDRGWSPEMARGLLPIDLKTEIVMTANLREWRHFFRLRASRAAHPQMVYAACCLLRLLRIQIPVIFDDVGDLEAQDFAMRRRPKQVVEKEQRA